MAQCVGLLVQLVVEAGMAVGVVEGSARGSGDALLTLVCVRRPLCPLPVQCEVSRSESCFALCQLCAIVVRPSRRHWVARCLAL